MSGAYLTINFSLKKNKGILLLLTMSVIVCGLIFTCDQIITYRYEDKTVTESDLIGEHVWIRVYFNEVSVSIYTKGTQHFNPQQTIII